VAKVSNFKYGSSLDKSSHIIKTYSEQKVGMALDGGESSFAYLFILLVKWLKPANSNCPLYNQSNSSKL